MRAAFLLVLMLVGVAVSAPTQEKRAFGDAVKRLKEKAFEILGKIKGIVKDRLKANIDLAVNALKGIVTDDATPDKCIKVCSSLLSRFAPACDDLCKAALESVNEKISG